MPAAMVEAMQLTGNDIGPIHYIRTYDMGKRWTPPMESQNLLKIPLGNDVFEMPWLRPVYHKKTDTLLVIGGTAFVQDEGKTTEHKMERHVPRRAEPVIAYAIWNWDRQDFESWEKVRVPQGYPPMAIYTLQTHELDDGTIICPFTCVDGEGIWKTGTLKMLFDGRKLEASDVGNTVGLDKPEGAVEPSIVEFGDKYFMTIRSQYGLPSNNHDGRMYHATSNDGMNWRDFEPWRWDDATIVETEQTQQHWLRHDDTLYLVYTRKSELRNGVFRSRAPLWIAQVDVARLRLIKDSERIVFPENGARTGNFCTANVTENEAWILTGEWLEQMVAGYRKGMPFWCNGGTYNRIQYIGDLLLARVHFR